MVSPEVLNTPPGFEDDPANPEKAMIFWPDPTPTQKEAEEVVQTVLDGNFGKIRQLLAGNPGLLNAAGRDNQTALHAATAKEATGIAAYLIGQGANVDAQDSRGRTPLIIATENACQSGHADIMSLLIEAGADVTIGDNLDRVAKVIPLSQGKSDIAAAFDAALKQRAVAQIATPCRSGVAQTFKVGKPIVLKK